MSRFAECASVSHFPDRPERPLKVAVIGACASGKSSLAKKLSQRGFDAFAVGQEHSIVANLWMRREPDYLIYLDVNLETIRRRRSDPGWPAWIYELQIDRLKKARASASITIDTVGLNMNEVVDSAHRQLLALR